MTHSVRNETEEHGEKDSYSTSKKQEDGGYPDKSNIEVGFVVAL